MIKRLDGDIATRIAAGEVIERPSSVAKELIENSIDAMARTVTIYTEQGGKSSFVIEDDGTGIAAEELPLALERYATSKISSIDDLENITTLGYRGEALASVAAVSRMEIRSRTMTSDIGGIIKCEGGVITLHTESPCKQGTRIQVDDLFFNLPARRKFLKTSSAELRRIIQIINDYALIHTDITFRLFGDGKKILEHLPASGTEEALSRRWGDDAPKYYSASTFGRTEAKIWWNPMQDSRRIVMSLFVNNRRVQDSTVRAAISGSDFAAYGEWLVLINTPPEQLDVNIHPTKEEIRFRRSGEIFKIVHDNAQNILAKRFAVRTPDSLASFAAFGEEQIKNDTNYSFERNVPVFSPYKWPDQPFRTNNESNMEAEAVFTPAEQKSIPFVHEGGKRYIGQTARGFLLFDFPGGMAIVDPHAAHERILFEDICGNFKDIVYTQQLAMPLDIPLSLSAEANLYLDELKHLGFTAEAGQLTGVPMIRGKGHTAPLDMLRSVLRGIETERDPAKRDREVWWRMARLACRDAVKLGQRFERQEAEELLRRLDACETPYTCPHGRPVIFLIDDKKLEDWFER